MLFRKFRLWILCRFAEGIFYSFLALLHAAPVSFFRRLSMPLLKVLIVFVVPRRRIIKNLGAAFGATYSMATKRGFASGVQDHFARNLADCFIQLARPQYAREAIILKGLKNLEAALTKGNGVIALGAHIGNFALVGTRVGSEGFRFHTLFRLPRDRRIGALVERHARIACQEIIPSLPKRKAASKVLEVLKRNEIVFILADNLKSGKIDTQLFGQRVRTSRGPVSLALRSGAAVVPMYIVRNYQGILELVIEPEISMVRGGKLAADIVNNTHRIADYLEGLISSYPDQWNWLTVRMRGSGSAPARFVPEQQQNSSSSNAALGYTASAAKQKRLFWSVDSEKTAP
jgi:KDO2-lipid IV(A) lauroyltransferase